MDDCRLNPTEEFSRDWLGPGETETTSFADVGLDLFWQLMQETWPVSANRYLVQKHFSHSQPIAGVRDRLWKLKDNVTNKVSI